MRPKGSEEGGNKAETEGKGEEFATLDEIFSFREAPKPDEEEVDKVGGGAEGGKASEDQSEEETEPEPEEETQTGTQKLSDDEEEEVPLSATEEAAEGASEEPAEESAFLDLDGRQFDRNSVEQTMRQFFNLQPQYERLLQAFNTLLESSPAVASKAGAQAAAELEVPPEEKEALNYIDSVKKVDPEAGAFFDRIYRATKALEGKAGQLEEATQQAQATQNLEATKLAIAQKYEESLAELSQVDGMTSLQDEKVALDFTNFVREKNPELVQVVDPTWLRGAWTEWVGAGSRQPAKVKAARAKVEGGGTRQSKPSSGLSKEEAALLQEQKDFISS